MDAESCASMVRLRRARTELLHTTFAPMTSFRACKAGMVARGPVDEKRASAQNNGSEWGRLLPDSRRRLVVQERRDSEKLFSTTEAYMAQKGD